MNCDYLAPRNRTTGVQGVISQIEIGDDSWDLLSSLEERLGVLNPRSSPQVAKAK